jgi:SSS family transporter
MNGGLNLLDWTIIIGYIVGLVTVSSFFFKEQKTVKDFFVASKSMPAFAVGFSILATLLSAISITGGPAEIWENGLVTFGWWWIAIIASAPVIIRLFIRNFSKYNIISVYEYLEIRFNFSVRILGSLLFMLIRGSYIGLVIYASAMVLKPGFSPNFNFIWLMVIIGFVSALFAILGGMKAVIWTDVIQLVIVYIGITWLAITIIMDVDGGILGVWEVCNENEINFNYLNDSDFWSLSIFEKTTLWGLLIGFFFNDMAQKGADQLTVQRYLTTRSEKEAARSLWISVWSTIPMTIIMTGVSLALVAFYKTYPEKMTNVPSDSLLPHYIINEVPHGISGLIIAAIIAAILSTVDSGLNCLATVTFVDFHKRIKPNIDDKNSVLWARVWTLLWAVITTGLAVVIYLTAKENVLRTSTRLLGLFFGPLLGIFLLGLLTKRANTFGVLIGAFAGTIVAIWLNYFTYIETEEGIKYVSFVWPLVFGVVTTFITGYILSFSKYSKISQSFEDDKASSKNDKI